MIDPMVLAQLSGKSRLQEWLTLEQTPTLIDGGGADTGGPNKLPHGTATWTSANATSTASLQFKPKPRPKGQPWDNAFNYAVLAPSQLACNYFSHQFQFMFPTEADIAACTAVEFVVEVRIDGWAFDMEYQYLLNKPAWRIYDPVGHAWIAVTALPPPKPIAGVFVRAVAMFSLDKANRQFTHEQIMIDENVYPVGLTHKATLKWPGVNNAIFAVQTDSDGKGSPFSVKIKNWNVRGL